MYLLLPQWSQHLRWMSARIDPDEPHVSGRFVWHAWELSSMLPKTFSWRYDPDYTWHAVRYFESNRTARLGLPRYLMEEIERCRDPCAAPAVLEFRSFAWVAATPTRSHS